MKFDRDRVRTFQRNVQTNEKFEQLKNLVNRTELNKPDLDHCVLRLNDLIIDSARKTCPVSTRMNRRKRVKDRKH